MAKKEETYMLKTIIILASTAFLLTACGGNTMLGGNGGFLGTGVFSQAGDVCTGKDSQGVFFTGELGQEVKGGLVCVPGGGAR